jgi:diguanylate cyclase (GGDEF)-like protein/PAS domain S-box-containing protein
MKELINDSVQLNQSTRFKSLMQSNVISLFLLDDKGVIKTVNENGTLLVDHKVDELIGKSFFTLMSIQHQNKAIQQFIQFKKGNITNNSIEVCLHNSVENKMNLTFSFAEVDSKQYGIYGLLSQVRKNKEEEQSRLESVIDHLDVSIWAADYETQKYTHVSFGTEKIYGYPPEAFYNDPLLWAKVIYPEDLPKVEIAQKLLKQGIPADNEYRIYHANGEMKWISDRVIPKLDENGNIRHYYGIIKDITAQKFAEQKLFENKQKYRSLYDFNPFAVYTLDTDGNFLDGNPAGETLIGYSKDEMVGKPFLPLLDEDYVDVVRVHFMKVLRGEAQNYNVIAFHKNGQKVKLNITNIPVIVNGEVVGVHGIAKDLSPLQESEEKYRKLVEQSLVGVYIIQNGKFVYTNHTLNKMFGYDNPLGLNSLDVIHPDDRDAIAENLRRRLKGEDVPVFEARGLKSDGSTFYVEILGATTKYNGIPAVTGMVLDVTKRKQMEKTLWERDNELRMKEGRYQSLIKHSSDVIKIIDQDGIIQYVGPTIENSSSFKVEEIIGQDAFQFIHPDDKAFAKNRFKEIVKSYEEPVKFELRVSHSKGEYTYSEVTATNRLNDPNVNGIVFNFKDITDQKKAQQKIHHLAYHDELTGLPNRRFLLEKMEEELSIAKLNDFNFALLFFDIDGFKFVNDSLGHFSGDELLKQVATRLLNYIKNKGFVARIGGDEFTLLVKNATKSDASEYARDILNLFKEPFQLNNYEFFVTVSIGISVFPQSGENVQSLLRNADIAMYRAKDNGKNNFSIYSSKMEEKTLKTFELRNDLRKALEYNEFSIHYQPRIDVRSDCIIGAEALLRWKHPKYGYVSPIEFIPLAEETGLIIPISNWVLKTVCEQHRRWLDSGIPPIKISVNFSALQFLQRNLLKTITKILSNTEMDPSYLEIEITESVVMENEDPVLSTIEKMKNMGIHIAIDDFGTGYSSISYLKKFKIDTLKIDRSFIKAIPTDSDSVDLTNATIQLAQSLNLNIVAEGVEKVDQLEMLIQSGCLEVQGFLYSKPVPEDEFKQLLNKSKCNPIK